MRHAFLRCVALGLACAALPLSRASGQTGALEKNLLAEGPAAIASAARIDGDPVRGAIVFHQPHVACIRCHAVNGTANGLGPDLTRFDPKNLPADEALVEAVLLPSKTIRKGFEPVTIVTVDGKATSGLVVEETPQRIVLQDFAPDGKRTTIAVQDVEVRRVGDKSPMPQGLANQFASRQQFLDLVRYLIEIRDGGLDRARALQPSPALYALRLPEYESRVDHAGLIRSLDRSAFQQGKAIYERLCVNCHGTPEKAGSLPTSLRFATGRFKSGSDPYTMYRTLTHGFGLMVPQTWMVPEQKYAVIHYVREEYLKTRNPSQHFPVTDAYLAGLPVGDTRGPAPRTIEPWVTMDYGPSLTHTWEVGENGSNIAYKGIAVRLDAGAGGISRGRAWSVFEHDTLRVAACWTGSGFVDWRGIQFDGRHGIHPRIVGDVWLANPTGPGWANSETGSFADDRRVVGRDGRKYGPLPREWGRFRGVHHHGDRVIVAYEVGGTPVLESPAVRLPAAPSPEAATSKDAPQTATTMAAPVFARTFEIGPRKKDLLLLVATEEGARLSTADGVAVFGKEDERAAEVPTPARFDGASHLEVADAAPFDMTTGDFTVAATIRTKDGGTILARTPAEGNWAPDGKALFVRGGKLCYDIGWVGVVVSDRRIDDGKPHDVALRWTKQSALAELFVDGQPAGSKPLRPKSPTEIAGQVLRVGRGAANFPGPESYFTGELRHVRFFRRTLSDREIAKVADATDGLVAHWKLDGTVADAGPRHLAAAWKTASQSSGPGPKGTLVADLSPPVPGPKWDTDGPRLCLRIPAGRETLRFSLRTTRDPQSRRPDEARTLLGGDEAAVDLAALIHGGPPRWPQTLEAAATLDPSPGPLASDLLNHPENNPWLAQMRFTGLDFSPDGDALAACTWDGDVWRVEGLSKLAGPAAPDPSHPAPVLKWKRLTSGLFQPLGIRIVDGRIVVTCRDQLAVLHDRNGDGEIDFHESLNSDHQVTEHFHEFAMGLQTDAEGNWYYAKSARHALPAVVPHHGTLLKVAKDGSRTEILATGFRAANGVCLNPDGTFVVTDQEGHWNPKNRINWVRRGGFYGNMFGYHDVTDSSDGAMEPPLCWITNAFDRSPAELLWTPRDAWGPLGGSLLNLSYGYGKVYVVPFEEVDGRRQGGLCALPIAPFPTGVMRGRFHPLDRQLYLCGMFAWAGSATQPGGLYRLRYVGGPMHLPVGLHARGGRMEITFTDPVDRATATDVASYAVKTWSLKRTAGYGSKHYDERPLRVTRAKLSEDGRTVTLEIPDLQPTWGMEIVCRLKDATGRPFERVVHNSVFALGR